MLSRTLTWSGPELLCISLCFPVFLVFPVFSLSCFCLCACVSERSTPLHASPVCSIDHTCFLSTHLISTAYINPSATHCQIVLASVPYTSGFPRFWFPWILSSDFPVVYPVAHSVFFSSRSRFTAHPILGSQLAHFLLCPAPPHLPRGFLMI